MSVIVAGVVVPVAHAEIGPEAVGPETVTAAPVATWQTNGTVWDLAVVNNVVYVAGSFTKVRPPGAAPGTDEISRNRLAAFDATTGALLPWAPSANSPVQSGTPSDNACTVLTPTTYECATAWALTVTPDMSQLIVGGDFQSIDGKSRAGLAAFAVASGALNTIFKPSLSGRVYSVAATNSAVYAGGGITRAAGTDRSGLAAFEFPSGVLSPFAPTVVRGTASSGVNGIRSIALTADASRLVVGGGFNGLNATTVHGLGALDPVTGATAPWNSNRITSAAYVTSVNLYGDTIYTTADAAGSTSEGIIAFEAATGRDLWYDSCRGASHSMAVVRDVVYVGSHSHDCGVMDGAWPEQYQGYASGDRRRYTLRAEIPNGRGGAQSLHWFPRTNDGNGARAMATDDTNLWIGGEFTSVDNAPQQGLTHFTFLDSGGSDRKPLTPDAPIATSTRPGLVDISFQQTEDPDNARLEYALIRDGDTSRPIHTVTTAGKPWLAGWMHYQDTAVAAGSTHTYEVRATDPLGTRSNRSPAVSVTVADTVAPAGAVAVRDGAVAQYSFESVTNNRFLSGAGTRSATIGSRVTTSGIPGTPTSGQAIGLGGASGGVVVDTTREYSTRSFSIEALFATTTRTGGVIASTGDSSSTFTVSNSNVGNLYLDNAGRLNWGAMPDVTRTDVWASPSASRVAVSTSRSFNDGAWHHVVATFEPATGARIFVDGILEAENPNLNWSRSVNAYLRVGADRVASWPSAPSNAWLNGRVDEVALYRYPLAPEQATFHADSMLGRLAAPTGLRASTQGPSEIALSWVGVANAANYEVLRDGAVVSSPTATTFTDTGLSASTSYTYTVRARTATTTGPASPPATAITAAPPPVALLATGSTWRYDESGTPTAQWQSPSFDDSAWAVGPSKFGYGGGDEATILGGTAADGTTRIATYLRTSFDVAEPAKVRDLALKLKRDDGVVIYLNGTEILRDLMPNGAIAPRTLASSPASDNGRAWNSFSLPTSALVPGRNVIAVEVHQAAATSVDLALDVDLQAVMAEVTFPAPAAPTGLVATVGGTTSVDVRWNEVAGATDYVLYRDGNVIASQAGSSFTDSGLQPGTTVAYRVRASNAVGDSPLSAELAATTDSLPPVQLLASGSNWKYEASGVETTGWRDPAFDDSAWGSGPSQLGHGEGDEETALTPFGSDGTTRRVTTYFRTAFQVDDPAAVKGLAAKVKRDDGIVLYLNGVEVWRDLLPSGTLTPDTLATTFAPDDGQNWIAVALPKGALASGRNVVAAELHQNARSSLDLSFDLDLVANR